MRILGTCLWCGALRVLLGSNGTCEDCDLYDEPSHPVRKTKAFREWKERTMLAVNIGSEGFMGVMWVIFSIVGSIYFVLQSLLIIMGRLASKP